MGKLLTPPTPLDRYFSLHYALSLARKLPSTPPTAPPIPPSTIPTGEDTCIARHHNGLLLICLSPRHPVVRLQKPLSRIEYRVPMRQVKGKRKRGGIVVEQRTKLCLITCQDGERYSVQCAVKGTVAEYNTVLETSPDLVRHKPLSDGYLAVILPWPSMVKTAVDDLITADDYEKMWSAELVS